MWERRGIIYIQIFFRSILVVTAVVSSSTQWQQGFRTAVSPVYYTVTYTVKRCLSGICYLPRFGNSTGSVLPVCTTFLKS